MNIDQLKQDGKQVFAAACKACNNQSRAEAVSALMKAADDMGLTGYPKRFAVGFGLAQFGYGGGW